MSKVDDVIAEAKSWLGTPWHHNARVKGRGVDCGNLICAVYENAGAHAYVDCGEYAEDWNLHRGEELFIKNLKDAGAVKIDCPEAGCVALWRYGRSFSHSGIMIDDCAVIHAYKPSRSVIMSRIDQDPLKDRDVQFWRVIFD